jgi:VIT1/CCC1 family predicted Fe2+/Mn2+ transporter
VITSDKEVWVDTMMKEELGMTPVARPPLSRAGVTFIAFALVGLVPLLFYVFEFMGIRQQNLFLNSCILTGVAFVGIGLLKSYVGERVLWRGAVETLLLGAIAAALAYFAGNVLEKII